MTEPRLHQSLAHVLISASPLHCWYKAFGGAPEKVTDAADRGQVAHSILLGGKAIQIVYEANWRKSAAQELRDEIRAQGKLPVLGWQYEEAKTLASNVAIEMVGRGFSFCGGEKEKTVVWKSPNGPVCEGRIDVWVPQSALILDFKFVRSASRTACENSFINYGYDIQHAAYTEAIETVHPETAGRLKMLFVFIESEPPHAIRIMPVGGTMRTSGIWRWAKACGIWQECLEKYGTEKPWPAYPDDGEAAQCPAWALNNQIAEAAEEEMRVV